MFSSDSGEFSTPGLLGGQGVGGIVVYVKQETWLSLWRNTQELSRVKKIHEVCS